MESTPHCYDNLFQKSPLLDCLNCYHCFYRFLMKKLRKQLPDVFYEKKVFLKVSQNLQTNTRFRVTIASLFFKKIARLCSGLTIKTPERNLAFWSFFCKLWTLACNWHRCFPVNFAKFLRATFLQNNSVRLLLQWYHYSFNVLEVYIETSQISKTELFAKIVKELKAIFAKTSFWCFYC